MIDRLFAEYVRRGSGGAVKVMGMGSGRARDDVGGDVGIRNSGANGSRERGGVVGRRVDDMGKVRRGSLRNFIA